MMTTMMRRLSPALLVLLLLAIAATGCAGGSDGGPDQEGQDQDGAERPGDGASELDGMWTLTNGTGPDGPIPLVASAPITLNIDGTDWGGTAACNLYGGTVQIDGNAITSVDAAVTEMACMDDGVMESEAAYLAAYVQVDAFELNDGTLVLTGPAIELTFAAQEPEPDAEVVDTDWLLDALVSGSGDDAAVSSTWGESTLRFGDDGRLMGDTGCNAFGGEYELDGDRLLVGPIDVTDMACDDGLMTQEEQVLGVLDSGEVALSVDGSSLTLTAPDGRALIYRTAD
jgi:heat shock protein HslJ